MTVGPDLLSDARAKADREATDWLILLQDDPDNSSMRARFDAWLGDSDINRHAWGETLHVAEVIDAAPPAYAEFYEAPATAAAVSRLAERRPLSRRQFGALRASRSRGSKGLVAIAAACMVLVVGPDLLLGIRADHQTGTGEIGHVRLHDGSLVSLGTRSAIRIADNAAERRVELLRGEAYFEVERNPSRPFRVTSGDVDVVVLGTGFEVRQRNDGTDVSVRHGSVRVDGAGVSERLATGQQIHVADAGRSTRSHIKPTKVAAWTGGQLIVSDRPISEAIDELRPWYGGLILTVGMDGPQRVTGVFDLKDPNGALVAMARAHDARVRQISPWITIISSK